MAHAMESATNAQRPARPGTPHMLNFTHQGYSFRGTRPATFYLSLSDTQVRMFSFLDVCVDLIVVVVTVGNGRMLHFCGKVGRNPKSGVVSMSNDVAYHIGNGSEILRGLIGNGDAELFLQFHHQFHEIE